jgi:hypothetical protein
VTSKESPALQQALQWQQACVDTTEDRLAVEAAQLRRLGVLDHDNLPTSNDLPADMLPESTADVTAL